VKPEELEEIKKQRDIEQKRRRAKDKRIDYLQEQILERRNRITVRHRQEIRTAGSSKVWSRFRYKHLSSRKAEGNEYSNLGLRS